MVTVAGNVDRETEIAEKLARSRTADLVLRCLDRTELLAALRGARIDVVVIVGAPRWLDMHAVAEAAEHSARVVGIAGDPLEAESLRHFGVPVADPNSGLRELLETPPEPVPPTVESKPIRGRLIAVWGPKGAPGRSTIAIEIAAEIAATEPRTVLVDADTYGGDIAQMLAIVEEVPTIVWAAQAATEGTLDGKTLSTMLRRAGAGGPVLLPGINRSELWTDISSYGWSRLLEVLTASFAFTVVDVGFGIEFDERMQHERDRVARQTIVAAGSVVAVCRADPVGIKSFLWSMERMKELRGLDDVYVVANKVAPGDTDEVGYVLRKHLGKRPFIYLPGRHEHARAAVDRGSAIRDLRPSGDIASGVRDLASALGARVRPRGLLTRLGGRG